MKCKRLVFGVVCVMGVLLVSGAEAETRHLRIYDSALYDAVLAGKPAVRRLLEGGTAVNATDGGGLTLLHYATAENRPGIIRFLLKKQANIEAPSRWGPPLSYAVRLGHGAALRVLLQNGAKVDGSSKAPRQTPLHLAVSRGDRAVARILLENGADVAAQDRHGRTPLHLAVVVIRARPTLKLLLKYAVQNGMDVDVQEDTFGYTPLHQAAQGAAKTSVKLLLEAGADTEVTEEVIGATPLHFAAQFLPASVGLFITHEADVNAATDSGATPLDKAVRAGNTRAVKLLKKAGAKHSAGFDPNPEGD